MSAADGFRATISSLRLVSCLACCVLAASPATAGVLYPSGFHEEVLVDGLDQPTTFAYASDGRLFIAEKTGGVRVVTADGRLLPTPFVTVPVNLDGDRGLVGIALSPDFPVHPYVYLAYTTNLVPPAPDNWSSRIHRVTRWTASGDEALADSEIVVIDGIPSDSVSHTGGALVFGPDGTLFVATGDGADFFGADPLALRAQDLDQLCGKVLRVNPDGSAPSDNPYYTTPEANRSKVWQYGLRNPFRAAFRPGTSRLYVNDVGWSAWEEVDSAEAGANFGWPCYEGDGTQALYYEAFPEVCSNVVPAPSLHAYPHDGSGRGVVTGGVFCEGRNYPLLYRDRYFFADFGQGTIGFLVLTRRRDVVRAARPFARGGESFLPVDLTVGPDGNLHYLNFADDFATPSGSVRRIVYGRSARRTLRP